MSVTSASSSSSLPATHRALVCTSTSQPLTLETVPTPQPTPGSAVVRVLASGLISYMRDIYNGTRPYPFPSPMVPGSSAVGRVAATGPDATRLTTGQLVYADSFVRGRDDPTQAMLMGLHQGHSPSTHVLMRDSFRDATFAEYAKFPLENLHVLDEARLLGDQAADAKALGYDVEELAFIAGMTVPYGGLRDVGLGVGETVIVAPATGQFGGAAVVVALGMGAGKVIAMGRDQARLANVKAHNPSRIETVPLTGSVEELTQGLRQHGPTDVFIDISPPQAAASAHVKAGILSVKHGGRISLMGGIRDDVPLPYGNVMHGNKTLKGKWMYEREDLPVLIKMIEAGTLRIGKRGGCEVVGRFGLEGWKEALDVGAERSAIGECVVIAP